MHRAAWILRCTRQGRPLASEKVPLGTLLLMHCPAGVQAALTGDYRVVPGTVQPISPAAWRARQSLGRERPPASGSCGASQCAASCGDLWKTCLRGTSQRQCAAAASGAAAAFVLAPAWQWDDPLQANSLTADSCCWAKEMGPIMTTHRCT